MSKAKQFIKNTRKKGKQKDKVPETADEFLAVGVEHEEAGEKWRGGDAAKSTRFFIRAIEDYENGLRAFPRSFDLAYNKARVQYQLTQHPRLVAELPTPPVDLLQLALESHRYALGLRSDDADVLFNTAQVLRSLAEVLFDGRRSSESVRHDALQLLQEALELFQRCLIVQELQFTQSQELMEMADETAPVAAGSNRDDDQVLSVYSSEEIEDERWASVVEPVTKDTLVDTAVTQLETLTTACGMLISDSGSGLAWVEEYSKNLLQGRIAAYVTGTDRLHEVELARANFICALADTSYRAGRADLQTYERELKSAFGPHLNISQDFRGLCDHTDALIAFSSAVFGSVSITAKVDQADMLSLGTLMWQQLTTAAKALTSASKLPTAQNLAKVYIARGDVELLRLRLGESSFGYATAKRSAATLLKNSETYYRGAVGLANIEGSMDEELEATVKLAVASTMIGDESKQVASKGGGKAEILAVVEEMVGDGIVGSEWLSKFKSV